jgi:hypothetical protein
VISGRTKEKQMNNTIAASVLALALAMALSLVAPAASVSVGGTGGPEIGTAAAEAAPSSGASSAKRAGDKSADLIRGWVGPLLIALIGVFALVALAKREVGMAVSAALIGLIAGFFVFAPESVETLFKGIYDAIAG